MRLEKKKLKPEFFYLGDLMLLTKPQSRLKRGFCGFRFLPSQLLATKHVTQLFFLQINYIFVTLRKQGLVKMGTSFLLREYRKDGGMNVEAPTAGEMWARNTGLLKLLPLPRVCSCLRRWGWIVGTQPSDLK